MNLKYFAKSCEPEAELAYGYLSKLSPWDHYLAIPCCGEDRLLPSCLKSILDYTSGRSLLLALTINEGPETSDEYKQSNHRTLSWLFDKYDLRPLGENLYLANYESCHLLVIDRTGQNSFPKKQGVGLARKIGNDIGAYLHYQGLITSPWLHNSDGDAILPEDYLKQVDPFRNANNMAVIIYDYEHHKHKASHGHWEAAVLYELWLRYYVLAMRYAGSPYDFPTIGSTLTIHADAYTKVHGFPKKMAGEDFYLLNKLAKIGRVLCLKGQRIILQDRYSQRVPFGTGTGTQKIADLMASESPFVVYHPRCFDILKTLIRHVEECIRGEQTSPLDEVFSPVVSNYLKGMDIEQAITEACARGQGNIHLSMAQFHYWFDAFKSLKFIHFLRDHLFPNLEWNEALKLADFIPDFHPGMTALEKLLVLRGR